MTMCVYIYIYDYELESELGHQFAWFPGMNHQDTEPIKNQKCWPKMAQMRPRNPRRTERVHLV